MEVGFAVACMVGFLLVGAFCAVVGYACVSVGGEDDARSGRE